MKKINIVLLFAYILLYISSCSSVEIMPESLEELYDKALRESEANPNLTSSIDDFTEIIQSYPGTKFASFSRLRLAEILFSGFNLTINNREDLNNAEIYYRSFLLINPGHKLEPFIYSRLAQISYIKSVDGFLTSGTDVKPFYDSLQLFNNMQLLYSDNYYFDEIKYFANKSSDKLATYEHNVGNWYYDHKIYGAAINRFKYVFKNFPQYSNRKELAKDLILAYEKNLQLDQAKIFYNVYLELYPNQD